MYPSNIARQREMEEAGDRMKNMKEYVERRSNMSEWEKAIEDIIKKEDIVGVVLRQIGEKVAMELMRLGEVKELRQLTDWTLLMERACKDEEGLE